MTDAPEALTLRPMDEYGWDWPDPAPADDPAGVRWVRQDLYTAVIAERDALAARVAELEAALRGIADAKISFDYVTLVRNADGTIDHEAPASPFDRGKAQGYADAASAARAALAKP